ncbi:hypothetical protein V1508DRAFT_423472 [Lipomyces doorenjongii]|uniref:uncharacterized protein n=1 Tax=Lipomyces doorenjongii TaxID=383834 RepID=UPI0034CE51CE
MPLPAAAVLGIGLGVTAGIALGIIVFHERENIADHIQHAFYDLKVAIAAVKEQRSRRRRAARLLLATASDNQEMMELYDNHDKEDEFSDPEETALMVPAGEWIRSHEEKIRPSAMASSSEGLRHRNAPHAGYSTSDEEGSPSRYEIVSKVDSSLYRLHDEHNNVWDTSSEASIETPSIQSENDEAVSHAESEFGSGLGDTASESGISEGFEFIAQSGDESSSTASRGYLTEDEESLNGYERVPIRRRQRTPIAN